LTVRSGNQQSGPAGGVLAQALAVTASDASDNPVPGAIVRFRVTRGAATGTVLSDTVVVAGFDGAALVELRLGSALDTSVVEAFLPTTPTVVTRLTAVATPPPRLDAVLPATFASGDTVRLRGQFFHTTAAANIALFGTARGRVVAAVADTSLTVVVPPCVPAGAVSARVVVGTVTTNAIASTTNGAPRLTALRVLEGITVSGADLVNCIQLAGGGASYLLVPHAATQAVGSRRVDFSLTINSAALGVEPPVSARVPAPLLLPRPEPPSVARRFDLALREREAALVEAARAEGSLRAAPGVVGRTGVIAAPALGSQRAFQVLSKFDGSDFRRISARLRYAGDHILLYVDVDQPAGAYTDAELRTFGDLFDRSLYDIDVQAFGRESDIDANGRVIFVLTPVVNALTSSSECSASGFITGFHYGIDLLPNQTNSNRGEIFYALVPDPGGTRSCEHTKADVERLVPATFVHEFQHMISFGQHVVARGGSFETLWLNEGLSHIAEELGGKAYETKVPPPAGRTDPNQLFPDSAQGYLSPLMRNAQRFLESPGATSVTANAGGGSLAERGAAWLFLRWLGDQKGEAIYGRLVQTGRTGITNVEDKANESFGALFGDFVTAIYTDSVPGVSRSSVPARLRFSSRNFRQIFKRFADIDQSGRTPTFPFVPIGVVAGQTATGVVTLGSMAYYQLSTTTSDPSVTVRFSRPDLAPFAVEDNVQVSIFRLP
jgi:hypothetical protein